MSRELEFTGYWEGDAVYSCDCCHQSQSFLFDSQDIDSKQHRKELREKLGWITTKVDGEWHDFCSERCRNKFIRDAQILTLELTRLATEIASEGETGNADGDGGVFAPGELTAEKPGENGDGGDSGQPEGEK